MLHLCNDTTKKATFPFCGDAIKAPTQVVYQEKDIFFSWQAQHLGLFFLRELKEALQRSRTFVVAKARHQSRPRCLKIEDHLNGGGIVEVRPVETDAYNRSSKKTRL